MAAVSGVKTEANLLYRIFVVRLSMCIFQWDPEDVAALRQAKEGERAAKRQAASQKRHSVLAKTGGS